MSVGHPSLLLVAFALGVVTFALVRRRTMFATLLALAAFFFFATAADVRVPWRRRPSVAVLIDASPSTRGQWFRDADRVRSIARRLAPDAAFSYATFADGVRSHLDVDVHAIPDADATQTTLPTMDADAILLFSDGHLDLSTATTPTFPVVIDGDATLSDARLTSAERDGDRVIVTAANNGPPRILCWPDGTTSVVPTGTSRIAPNPSDRSTNIGGTRQTSNAETPPLSPRGRGGGRGRIAGDAATSTDTISLDANDAWPENDSLTLGSPPATFASERWWVGDTAPPGFRFIEPTALARLDLLAASTIIVNNISADALPIDAQAALARYVRDLGGGLLIIGGTHAFSAGGYGGTALDALSPLASWPPEPQCQWIVLIDASGSMAGVADAGRTKLDLAIDAAAGIVAKAIPRADAVAVGTFARDVRWWPGTPRGRSLAPPADVAANGPTNLRAAIAIAAALPHDRALHVVVLTDGQADLGDIEGLAASLRADHVTLDWVRLASGDDVPLARLAMATGGTVVDAGTPADWATTATAGLRAATAIAAQPGPIQIRWGDGATSPPVTDVNVTDARADARPLARTTDGRVVAADWRVGLGRVAALGWAADAATIDRVAARVATPPRDPRFAVRWLSDRVVVDAHDGRGPMNGASVRLRVDDAPATSFEQTGPGRYDAPLPARPRPQVATILIGDAIVDARTLAGRYADEFTAVGIDRDALAALAGRTAGRVRRADDAGPPIVAWQRTPLAPWLAAAGALASAAALVVARRPRQS